MDNFFELKIKKNFRYNIIDRIKCKKIIDKI